MTDAATPHDDGNGDGADGSYERFIVRVKADPGASPGTLVLDPDAPPPRIHAIAYGPDQCEERDLERAADVGGLLGRQPVLWIDVVGLGSGAELRQIAELVDLHHLGLEDIVEVYQRPKVEEYGGQLFIVARLAQAGRQRGSEQVSLLVGQNFLVSFHERPDDCLEPVRERVRRGTGRIRACGPDYLAYAILDAITDAHFPLLEDHGEQLEEIEDEVLGAPGPEVARRIHDVRRELLLLRRTIWPMRELFNTLMRESTPLIAESTRPYLRDCYDHTIQLIELVDSYRELAAGLKDTYLASVSHRMNEIIKVLTVIATIFIPLTFVTGIYGMNFDPAASPWNMPELGAAVGYPICLGVMVLIAAGMLAYFRRIGWL